MLPAETVPGAPPLQPHRNGLKRPSDSGECRAPLKGQFHIYPYPGPESASDGPLVVHPACVIARSSLPLAYISSGKDESSHTGLFHTTEDLGISCSDGAPEDGEPSLLIVAVEESPGLLAIEHVETAIYSLTQLSPWVKLQHLLSLKSSQWSSHNLPQPHNARHDDCWWQSAALLAPSPPKKRRTEEALSKHIDHNPQMPITPEDLQQNDRRMQQQPGLQEAESEVAVEDPDTSLRNLVMQYLDCLYISKASQAYFAKTPLARARLAFQQAHNSEGLVESLRHMILSATCLDKKYSTVISDMVKNTSLGTEQDEKAKSGKTPLKRKLKKPKPNKNGLYSLEEAFVKDWWVSEQEGQSGHALDLLQKSTQQLRFRETLLQIVLIFEVMSLESHITSSPDKTDDKPLAKSRKQPEDLETLLDIHVDRLCIYQSLQDFQLDEHETVHQSVEADEQSSDQAQPSKDSKEQRDELKDFCTAVIIPFYGAKLPKNVKTLGRKVGVKVGASSLRKQPKDRPAPGTEIRRRRPEQVRDPLARTQSSQQPNTREFKAPSLSRSATDTVLNSLERQKSATPRTGALFGDTRRSLSRANSVTQSARGRTREVDMGAIYKFNESRQKKKTAVEQELKDAIATLKKPNRGLAVKEYVDASDSRNGATLGVKSAARRLVSGVQINATPKRQSKTSRLLQTPRREKMTGRENIAERSPDAPTDSADRQMVLNSALRPSSSVNPVNARLNASVSPLPGQRPNVASEDELEDSDMDGFVPQSAIKTARQDVAQDSPFKRPALPAAAAWGNSLSYLLENKRPRPSTAASSTAIVSSGIHVATTPTKGGLTRATRLALSPPRQSGLVTTTPTKPARGLAHEASAAEVTADPNAAAVEVAAKTVSDGTTTGQPSIYASLGWDDDDDDLS